MPLRHFGDEPGDVLASRVQRSRGRGKDRQHAQQYHGQQASRRPLPQAVVDHVATSFRREWMDIRIPKPAMRVTIDVPP